MGSGRRNATILWPTKGLVTGMGYETQPDGSSADLLNVRNYDPITGRNRGAQRAGLSRCPDEEHTSGKQIQDLILRRSVTTMSPYGSVLPSRSLLGLAVAGGNIKSFTCAGGFASVTNGTGALNANMPVIFSVNFYNEVFWTDGSYYKVYDGSSVADWTPTAGTMPIDASNNLPTLIEVYRGRIVLSGLNGDPHNWFMSAVADGRDWDYSPTAVTPVQAVAGNNANAGRCPDVINCMIPFFDDLMVFGCDHTIWVLNGDPMHGGYIDNVSDQIGMAYGRPWCILPNKTIMFFSSRGGIYRMTPGAGAAGLERMTAVNLDEDLAEVDLANTIVRMVWDDRTQGAHLFLTPTSGTTPGTHWYWDARNDAFFKDSFQSTDLDPSAVAVFDGDDPDDRMVLLGCKDSYVRKIDYDAVNDDTYKINSYCKFGPLQMTGRPKLRMRDLQVTLSTGSDDVTVQGFRGTDAEDALGNSAMWTATQKAGRNYSIGRRLVGASLFLKLGNSNIDESWAYERMQCQLDYFTGRGQRDL